jgi:hypothetical protein
MFSFYRHRRQTELSCQLQAPALQDTGVALLLIIIIIIAATTTTLLLMIAIGR